MLVKACFENLTHARNAFTKTTYIQQNKASRDLVKKKFLEILQKLLLSS